MMISLYDIITEGYSLVGNRLVGWNEKDVATIRKSGKLKHIYGEIYWADLGDVDVVVREDEKLMHISAEVDIYKIKKKIREIKKDDK